MRKRSIWYVEQKLSFYPFISGENVSHWVYFNFQKYIHKKVCWHNWFCVLHLLKLFTYIHFFVHAIDVYETAFVIAQTTENFTLLPVFFNMKWTWKSFVWKFLWNPQWGWFTYKSVEMNGLCIKETAILYCRKEKNKFQLSTERSKNRNFFPMKKNVVWRNRKLCTLFLFWKILVRKIANTLVLKKSKVF